MRSVAIDALGEARCVEATEPSTEVKVSGLQQGVGWSSRFLAVVAVGHDARFDIWVARMTAAEREDIDHSDTVAAGASVAEIAADNLSQTDCRPRTGLDMPYSRLLNVLVQVDCRREPAERSLGLECSWLGGKEPLIVFGNIDKSRCNCECAMLKASRQLIAVVVQYGCRDVGQGYRQSGNYR